MLTPPCLLTLIQLRRMARHFPLSHGVPRVDDRRVISGIIYVIRHGLQGRDAPAAYGPHKTLYKRFVRWNRLSVLHRIFASLAASTASAIASPATGTAGATSAASAGNASMSRSMKEAGMASQSSGS